MKITRMWTRAGADPFDTVEWTRRSSRIVNPDGSVVFEMKDVEVPAGWSQLATDIMVSKYFRKAGVPQRDAEGRILTDDHGRPVTGPERSVRQVVGRLAGCWRHWGERHGYFDTAEDAEAFHDELVHMLLTQMAAPNSPQWFNTGLHWAYGINGPAQGHWHTDPATGETRRSEDAYTHPQPHACFIQSIADDLVNPGGIMDLWVREARLFKYGSGTGTNFSALRGENEPLSGGGRSSGLMSFLRIGDRAAGAIKSGGTTRRAAKMVCLDLDHPDVELFINWKAREELKVAAMVEGAKRLGGDHAETLKRLGLTLDYDFNGEAYQTVSGQNSNNSVRVPNRFFRVLDENGDWELRCRTADKVARRVRARALWDQIGYAAWRCADPGVQFDSTINEWHTCPESGRINASNPCSEYMFLDDTACNLASINLLRFYDRAARRFDIDGYEHAARLWTVVLEVSVLMAQYPSKQIARLSHEFRTLGLGYANLGALLMQMGAPYDSDLGRAIGAALAAVLTGRSYAASAEMAAEHGPFAGFFRNRGHMLRIVRNHRRAAYGVPRDGERAADPDGGRAADHELGPYEGLEIAPVPIDADWLEGRQRTPYGGMANGADLLRAARSAWDQALSLGEQHGFRNAQATVIAPTGTIGLLMDCDTTGVEPDFALVKFKKLAGGGYFKIANQSLRPALEALGYDEGQVADILRHVLGAGRLDVPMPDRAGRTPARHSREGGDPTFADFLRDKGLDDEALGRVHEALKGAMELGFAFNIWTLGERCWAKLGLDGAADPLRALGLSRAQVDALNEMICGAGTVEGAPHLDERHYPVFDCANRCGRTGRRFIAPEGHIRMMAAVQPFISGAISKTINLPHTATVEDIQAAYRLSWELGLKANALYRDGCKLSQPLNTRADAHEDDEAEDEEAVEAGREEVGEHVAAVAHRIAASDDAPPEAAGAGATLPSVKLPGATLPGAGVGGRQPVEKIVERIVERPMRRRLPDTRNSITHKFSVAGHEGYLTVGLYDDGSPGELFITMAKEGSTIGGLMDSLGTAISVALQYGVPVESLVNKFSHQRFDPSGMTSNRDIPFAKSLVDYIFRWMGMQFIPGFRAANAPQRPSEQPAPAPAPGSSGSSAPGSSGTSEPAARRTRQTARPNPADQNQRSEVKGQRSEIGDQRSAPVCEDREQRDNGHPARSTRSDRVGGTNGGGDRPHGRTGGDSGDTTPRRPAIDDPHIAETYQAKHGPLVELSEKTAIAITIAERQNHTATAVARTLSEANSQMMGDAPACDVCGSITVRNGTCYKCLNCGNSMGCS